MRFGVMGILSGVSLAILGATLGVVGGGTASAIPAAVPPAEAVALSSSGGLWFDGQVVRQIGTYGTGNVVQTFSGKSAVEPYQVSASSRAVVLSSSTSLMSGPIRGPLSPVSSARFGCWLVGQPIVVSFGKPVASFVIAMGNEVVSDATWGCSDAPPRGPQPVAIRPAGRTRRWRILTWVPGTAPPVLAAAGTSTAVGVQRSRRRLHVRFLTAAGKRARPDVNLPDGYLQIPRPNRLVLTVPAVGGFPLHPVIDIGNPNIADDRVADAFVTEVYSAKGTRLRSAGRSATLPLVSGGHMVALDKNADGTETVFDRALATGQTRALVGFRNPQRTLITDAFLWPHLALVETSEPSSPCYARAGAPALTVRDVSHPGAFTLAPPAPAPLTPEQRLALCGPPPP